MLFYWFYVILKSNRFGKRGITVRLTISDIAKKTGYAKSTVSAALNNKPGVKPKTREEIQRIAAEMNYIPNEFARNLSMQTTNTIGIIVRDITNPFYAKICRAIENTASEHAYTTLILNTDGIREKELNAIRVMSGQMVSGVIIDISGKDTDLLMELNKFGLPFVVFGTTAGELAADSVEADDYNGAYQAAEYLYSCGHRKIGFVHGGMESVYSQRRLRGIRKALEHNGIELEEKYIFYKAKTIQEGYLMGKKLVNFEDLPTAIIAYNDLVAVGMIRALEENGRQVPDDISIIGFDDIELMTFPLTTVQIPEYEMGEKAAELLFDKIMGKASGNPREILLDTELVVRKSVKRLL